MKLWELQIASNTKPIGNSTITETKNILEKSATPSAQQANFVQKFSAQLKNQLYQGIESKIVDLNLSGIDTTPIEKPQQTQPTPAQIRQQKQAAAIADIKKQKASNAAQSLDLEKLKQQRQQSQAAGVQAQQQAIQQMKAKKAADLAKSEKENMLKKAAQQARLKPAFQQSAEDKIAIRKAKQLGLIKEQAENKFSISQYVLFLMKRYLKGVTLTPNETSLLKNYALALEDAIKNNKPEDKIIKDISNLSYLATLKSSMGAEREIPPSNEKPTALSVVDQIEKNLKDLFNTDKRLYAQVINKIKAL